MKPTEKDVEKAKIAIGRIRADNNSFYEYQEGKRTLGSLLHDIIGPEVAQLLANQREGHAKLLEQVIEHEDQCPACDRIRTLASAIRESGQ